MNNVFRDLLLESKINDVEVMSSLSFDNLLGLVLDLMKQAENLSLLNGRAKKELVLDCLVIIVCEAPLLSKAERTSMLCMIKNYLPHVIDFIITISRNKKILKVFNKSCKICF